MWVCSTCAGRNTDDNIACWHCDTFSSKEERLAPVVPRGPSFDAEWEAMTEPKILGEWLVNCRENFGEPPRRLSRFELKQLRIPAPWGEKRFREFFAHQDALLKTGRVVWAATIQANMKLHEPGDGDCPAAVLYSLDARLDEQPDLLKELAERLFSLKGDTTGDPQLQILADKLADEWVVDFKLPVPTSFTSGIQCYYTSIVVHRAHLPDDQLSLGCYPLLAGAHGTDASMILPYLYWPTPFTVLWKRVGGQGFYRAREPRTYPVRIDEEIPRMTLAEAYRVFKPDWGEMSVEKEGVRVTGKPERGSLRCLLGCVPGGGCLNILGSLLAGDKTVTIRYGSITTLGVDGDLLTIGFRDETGKERIFRLSPYKEVGFFGGVGLHQADKVLALINERRGP